MIKTYSHSLKSVILSFTDNLIKWNKMKKNNTVFPEINTVSKNILNEVFRRSNLIGYIKTLLLFILYFLSQDL